MHIPFFLSFDRTFFTFFLFEKYTAFFPAFDWKLRKKISSEEGPLVAQLPASPARAELLIPTDCTAHYVNVSMYVDGLMAMAT